MGHLTNRDKRLKQEAKAAQLELKQKNLLSYLGNYGDIEDIQEAADAAFDSQLKNISLPLATAIGQTEIGSVIDIGCGKGVLLQRLSSIDAFMQREKWIYVGVDSDANTSMVLNLAQSLGIHRRVDRMNLEKFYDAWPSTSFAPSPRLVVIRNVFHELDIENTTNLLTHLRENLQITDTLIIQDLQVFPVSERGNACWLPDDFCQLLESLDFNTQMVSEPTPKGNRWFALHCKLRESVKKFPEIDVRSKVVSQRSSQLKSWGELGWLTKDDEKFREVRIAKLDFDLQYAALQQQLIRAKVPGVEIPSKSQEAQILQKTFERTLSTFRIADEPSDNLVLLHSNSFRDRANYQDSLEEFLRTKQTVTLIYGGALSGKTALIKEVLSKRAYKKHVVLIDVQASSSVWNLLEQFLAGIGCRVMPEIFASLKRIAFLDIMEVIDGFLNNILPLSIVAIDHFERLIDPLGEVQDPEIRQLLIRIGNTSGSKIILTSRSKPDLAFIKNENLFIVPGCPMGRFPEGSHVENVLNDFVDLKELGADAYPDILIKAIDRHPYLSVLAALTLRKDGRERLTDSVFLDKIRGKMREALLRDLVDDASRNAIVWLALMRGPVPKPLIESLAGKASVEAAQEAGLLYHVYDKHRSDLVAVLGAGIPIVEHKDDLISPDDLDAADVLYDLSTEHARIAIAFANLYKIDNDPRWLREVCYHKLAMGDRNEIEKFGAFYKTEIFWASDYSYRVRKDYDAALWALEVALKLGLKSTQAEMRRASCHVRLKIAGGEQEFEGLIEKYEDASHIKNAYVDSLLYLKRYSDAYNVLLKYELDEKSNPWVAHEFGRVYFGLQNYDKAVEAFEMELRLEKNSGAFVYDNLARAYQKKGDAANEQRILTQGLKRHPGSNRLRLRHAAHLVRSGSQSTLSEALPILRDLWDTHRTDGRVLQQYCKLLCLQDNVVEAKKIWLDVKNTIFPREYSISIEVEILIHEKKWEKALDVLKQISQENEHLVGMKKEIYLAWARNENDVAKRREVAGRGLAVPMDSSLENNIPILLTSARLAFLAEDGQTYEKMYEKINNISPDVASALTGGGDEAQLLFWEGENFSLG
jgi:tetratricopeptide (TPR) repeat protein/SAM-dependent methyltransferase